MKTPLTHVQGRERQRGDAEWSERLASWLRIEEGQTEKAVQGLHRLHPYPGRMHPLWARRIMSGLPSDASIIDPFCGGGTVLVEARLAGLYARGSDVNPIAVRLARLRCIPPPPIDLLRKEADRCAAGCTRRRETPFSYLAQGEEAFPRHVLAGLISLRDEIEKTSHEKVREVLLFCLSPLLDKLAERPGRPAPRVPRNAVRDLFRERVDRWIEAFELLEGQPFAEAELADARWLPWKPGSSSAVVTSPPYPGVYDYMGEQERRLRWLSVPGEQVKQGKRKEMGRRFSAPRWTEDMRVALWQLCRAIRPGSPMFFVVGDGVMRGQTFRADRALSSLCGPLPLELVAVASQERPHFHGPTAAAFRGRPREEHLVMLRRTDAPLEPLPKPEPREPREPKPPRPMPPGRRRPGKKRRKIQPWEKKKTPKKPVSDPDT